MPRLTTPISQVLNFAIVHSHEFVTDGNLRIRFSPDGPQVLPNDAVAADDEQELVLSLRVFLPQNLDPLRMPLAPVALRNDHGWRLPVQFPSTRS
jgi:hypothetical protein